jgi:hypothetical protein
MLCDRCERAGIPVKRSALRDAVELHDALSHVNPAYLGFPSSERLAATLTYNFLIGRGHNEVLAAEVSDIVMATHPDIRPRTPEQIIIRAADLWNIGSSYEDFAAASTALFHESQIANGQDKSFADWIVGSHAFLRRFLWPLLELTPEAKDAEGRSVWHTQAMSNLSRQWTETFGNNSRVVAEFFPDGEIKPSFCAPSSFYIAMHSSEEQRQAALATVGEIAKEVNSAAFLIPGTAQGFSLASELCDTVVLHEPSIDTVCEAVRITKQDGVIVVRFEDTLDRNILSIAQALHSSIVDRRDEGEGYSLIMVKRPMI